MKVLVTGNGRNGSWAIRGQQLGAAIGAEVLPFATAAAMQAVDLVVMVKRGSVSLRQALAGSGRPWVWDVVDAYPQPHPRNAVAPFTRAQAIHWLKGQLDALRPTAVVWPTAQMQADAEWTGPQLVLPHHAWERYTPRPLSATVTRVGYEGAAHYLGRWERVLREACERRGWVFEPGGDLAACDIGVALRETGGYPARAWKSNVKLANIQALGIPALCSPESGYQEFASGAEQWIETPESVERAFNSVAPLAERVRLRKMMTNSAPRLHGVATDYLQFLRGIR